MEPLEMEGVTPPAAEPKPESEEAGEIRKDLVKFKEINVVAQSPGGKRLVGNLKRKIADDVDSIMAKFKGEEIELRCAVAKLIADLEMYKTLINADENVKLASDALAEALSEKLKADKD